MADKQAATTEAVTPIPAPVIEELPEGDDLFYDPLGEGEADVLAVDEELADLDVGMAQQVADTYNMAGLGLITQPVSAGSVMRDATRMPDIVGSDLTHLLTSIRGEDQGVQKDLITAAIANPRVGVEQRVALAQELAGMQGHDLNAVSRQAMHNANVIENSGDTPEEIEDREKGAEEAEKLPQQMKMETPMPVSEEEAREFFTTALNEYYSKADEETGGRDWMGAVIPFRFQAPVMQIYANLGLNQSDIGVGGQVLLGEALRMIREKVEGMNYEEKREALDMVIRVLKPNSGAFADGNDLVTMHTLEQIFYKDLFKHDIDEQSMFPTVVSNLIPSARGQDAVQKHLRGNSVTGMAVLDNFGSLLDLVGMGSLAKSTIQLGGKWMPKSILRMRKVAPEMATKVAADALDDETVRIKFPGLEKEDVVAASLPASAKALQEGGVNGMGEMIARQLDIKDRLLRIAEKSNLTAAERADAFAEIQKMYGDVAAKPTSTLHINESIFTQGPASATIEAMFGRTKSKPFSSLAQAGWAARNEIEQIFGSDAAVKIVWRNPATGMLEDVPAGMKPFTKGEFFLRAKDERAYESAPTLFHSLTMGEHEVANLLTAPSLWKHLRGPTLFSKETMDNIRLASRQRTEWNKLTAGLMSEVAHLSSKDSRALARVLKEGESVSTATGRGKTFAPSELSHMGLSEAAQKAYYGYRNATDIMFEVVNRHTRTRMLRDGVMDIHTPTGRVGFAQPRTLAQVGSDLGERSSIQAYDPATNAFVQLDRKGLDDLYKGEATLARLEQPMLGKGVDEATHVIVDGKSGTRALGLPRQVVTKVEGYYPHMWDGNYIVWGMTKSGNKYAIGLASNEADAKAVSERMTRVINNRKAAGKSNRFSEVRYDFDRSLTHDMARRGGVMEGLYQNMGGPVYGHRNGGGLRNFSKQTGDRMVDPIEAMLRGMEIVGSKVTKQETATYMRQKLYQYAKKYDLLKDPAKIPFAKEDLKFSADRATQYNKAKAYLEGIDNMLNMRDAVDEAVSKFYLGAAGLLNKLGLKALSTKMAHKAARGGDPMSALMGFMHRTTIASSPLGQGALQASQSMMMLGVAPIQYIKAVAQTGTVATLIGMRSAALHGGGVFTSKLAKQEFLQEADRVALLTGMSRDEIIKVVDTIMDNGLVSSVGYHTQMRNAIRSAAEERMMGKARGLNKPYMSAPGRFARAADASTFGVMSRFGFEAGESINQIATFLTLYNKDKAKGLANLADPDYVKRLIGSTAELTGDMIPETGFTYQRGWFKAAMQFVSFQHKMMLLMMPKALGGAKSLTGWEKAGMVFAQFLLFGRRGAPHMDAMYRVVDSKIREHASDDAEASQMLAMWNDPTTRKVMDGLIFDTAGNYVLRELFGSEQNYALSERFAPGGGSEFMMDRLYAIASNPTKGIFGLAGEKASKLYSFAKRVGDVTLANVREHDDVPLGDRMEELAKEGGMNVMSTYNRYLAVQAANALDGYVSAGGRITEGFSGPLEGFLYTHFGIMTKDRESLYQAMDKYMEEEVTNPLARQKNLDGLADDYYRDLIMTGVKFNDEATDDTVWQGMMDKWARERGLLFSILPPEDAEYIRDAVAARLEKAAAGSADSAETVFIERMSKDITSGRFGEEGPEVALYLDEAEFVRNNPKLKEIIRQAYIEANTDDYLERK